MADKLDLVSEGFRLNKQQRGLIIRVGWVAIVTSYMAWSLGLLSVFGAGSPFATAGDLQKMEQRMTARIDRGSKPTAEGFKSRIKAEISLLEEEIDVAKARKASAPARWTELDQRMLTRNEQRLQDAKDSLAAMIAAETAPVPQ